MKLKLLYNGISATISLAIYIEKTMKYSENKCLKFRVILVR